MKSTCPKCHAKIELDLPEVTEAGTAAVCPACNARFNVHRESFGGRALRRSNEISCAPCGSELGCQTYCPTCGAQFPDYLVATIGRQRARGETKKVKLKSSPIPRGGHTTSHLPTLEMAMRPEAGPTRPSAPSAPKYPKAMVIGVVALVAVALIAAGSMFYLKNKAEKRYTNNFIMAAYCIQTGTDKSLKASAKISADWKAKMDAGQPYTARPGMEDERDLRIINTKLEDVKSKLSAAPAKFAQCNEKIAKINSVYTKLSNLVLTPGNSLQNFTDSSSKLSVEYKQAAKEFKAGLPEEMMEELTAAGKKMRGLRPLLD
jgi:DNA-directed RNA polymerase subunit RPC12/RpoP